MSSVFLHIYICVPGHVFCVSAHAGHDDVRILCARHAHDRAAGGWAVGSFEGGLENTNKGSFEGGQGGLSAATHLGRHLVDVCLFAAFTHLQKTGRTGSRQSTKTRKKTQHLKSPPHRQQPILSSACVSRAPWPRPAGFRLAAPSLQLAPSVAPGSQLLQLPNASGLPSSLSKFGNG